MEGHFYSNSVEHAHTKGVNPRIALKVYNPELYFLFVKKLKRFRSREEQLSAFYLLLNSKNCTPQQIISLLNASGNGAVAKVYQPDERSGNDNRTEKEVWQDLQKLISNNIDRLSSHTMNLGLVLCFASGAELITGKDREIIVRSCIVRTTMQTSYLYVLFGYTNVFLVIHDSLQFVR